MKRRIYWTLCLTSLAAVLLTAALCLWAFYGFVTTREETALHNQCQILARALELDNGSDTQEITALSSRYDTMRVTLIAADGTVLADSVADPATMENHGDREEVQEALAQGEGESVRRSDTLGKDTYYYAMLLSGGRGTPGFGADQQYRFGVFKHPAHGAGHYAAAHFSEHHAVGLDHPAYPSAHRPAGRPY